MQTKPRFGLISLPSDWQVASQVAALVEDGGFDSLWVGDHLGAGFLDGWSLVAAWAAITRRVRLGVLASNMIYRNPAVLAQQIAAVDLISDGRLEIGLGAGELRSDHEMGGIAYWGPADRVARFREFVEIVDGLLCRELIEYQGTFYQISCAEVRPGPCQKPRPPLTIATYGPVATKVAARHADTWNTFCGGLHLPEEELIAVAALRVRMAERKCLEVGRDPSTLTKSILVPPQHQPWSSVTKFASVVRDYRRLGFEELLFHAPEGNELNTFARAVSEVLPLVREGLNS